MARVRQTAQQTRGSQITATTQTAYLGGKSAPKKSKKRGSVHK